MLRNYKCAFEIILKVKFGVEAEDFHLIGHSMGAQTAGMLKVRQMIF